jgi:hypothetical protein
MAFRLGANFWTFYAIGVAELIATLGGLVGLGLLFGLHPVWMTPA